MKTIKLNGEVSGGPVIMIFTEGTILRPRSWLFPYRFSTYIPVGEAAAKTAKWRSQGAGIVYCTSRKGEKAEMIAALLRRYSFPGEYLAARTDDSYKDVAESICPDVLIEDDCKSIGGARQMCITYMKPELKKRIRSIIVPEYAGIDSLPDELELLTGVNVYGC